jgi:membrane fusion protein (multidrug efflux system)
MKKLIALWAILLSLSYGSMGHLTITGTVISNNQKMIGARYMGYVKKVNFNIGDKVEREETLFELESAEFDILRNQADLALEQSKIMVDMYRTRMDSIKRERMKLKRLQRDGQNVSIDLQDLDVLADNVSAGLAAAQSLVKSAAEKIKQVATISDYLEVKAPNDGIIVQRRIQVGDLIAPGMLTMVLVDLNHLEIEAQIAESDLMKVKPNQKVELKIPSLKYETVGVVKSIVPSANPMSHTFTLRIGFKRDNHLIFPGMYAKVKIKYKR